MGRKSRQTVTELSPQWVVEMFKQEFRYDSITGEITNLNGRLYKATDIKGYRRSLYRQRDFIEYRFTYHRLCWLLYYGEFVPQDMTIDHINNIPGDNRIENLTILTNAENSYKRSLKRANSVTGLKGVSKAHERHNAAIIRHTKFIASISKDNKLWKIGRFKTPQLAAAFYDAANRYLFQDLSLCNFDKVLIKPQSIEDLRKLRKTMLPLSEMREQKIMEELLENCAYEDVGR